MYKRIMMPVDLAHADRLEKALKTAADLAKHYRAEMILVGVTGSEPGPVAHNPEEFATKLDDFAAKAADRLGTAIEGQTIHLHDITSDLNRTIVRKAKEIDADLVVMASHIPGVAEYIFGSHGGEVAQHAPMSVMLVRE